MVRHLVSRARSSTSSCSSPFDWPSVGSTSVVASTENNPTVSTCVPRCTTNVQSMLPLGAFNWSTNNGHTIFETFQERIMHASFYETQNQSLNPVYRGDSLLHCSPVCSTATSTAESWCTDQMLVSDCTMSMLRDLPLHHRRSAVHALASRWSTSGPSGLDTFASNGLTSQISNNNNLSPTLPVFPTNPNDCTSASSPPSAPLNSTEKLPVQPSSNSCHPALIASAAAALLSSVSSLQNQITIAAAAAVAASGLSNSPPISWLPRTTNSSGGGGATAFFDSSPPTNLITPFDKTAKQRRFDTRPEEVSSLLTSTTTPAPTPTSALTIPPTVPLPAMKLPSRTKSRDQAKLSLNHELSGGEFEKQNKITDSLEKPSGMFFSYDIYIYYFL
ncbi:unnamed protein product [Trichobilharzia regenti]|nr:unnamed protein product [Trichobilharzia regenti]